MSECGFDRRGLCAVAAVLAAAGAALGQTDVFWDQAVDGFWNDAGNWDPAQVPNNAGNDTFNAFIDVTGVPFTVTLDVGLEVTLTGFELSSGDATLDGAGGNSFTVLGDAVVAEGVVSNIDIFTSEGSIVLSDTRLESLTLDSTGSLEFNSTGCDDICDSDVNKISGVAGWNAGDINLQGNSSFTLGNCAEFQINTDATLMGDPGTLFDTGDGAIFKNSTGLTEFAGVTLMNTGTLDVGAGTFLTDGVDVNGNGNTLGGGTWIVRDTAALDLVGQQAIINAADVTIEGTGQFDAITDNIEVIDPAGRLALDTGSTFTTPGDLTNDGELVLGDAQTFIVSGNLTNFLPGGELAGGVYDVGLGQLQFAGAAIEALSAEIRVGDPNGITDLGGNEAISVLEMISPMALAQLFGGGLFVTTPLALQLDGQLIVGEDADGTTVQISSGPGLLDQTGTLTLDGGPATGTGATARIGDAGMGDVLLASMDSRIEGSGVVEAGLVDAFGRIAPGRSAGQLVFSQSTVQVQPSANVDIEIGGAIQGAERDFILVDLGVWQHVGGVAGTLNVALIDGFVPPQGQFFEVIFATEGIIGAFADFTYDGPGSLTLQQGPNTVGVFICPADCNQDGQLTLEDFICFQTLFQSGDDDADINGDGELNILDFRDFQTAFVNGCEF